MSDSVSLELFAPGAHPVGVSEDAQQTRCGYVAIVGRPNVGKSTLLNAIVGRKISIVTRKPQTTRHRIVGVKTSGDIQAIYVDTPGLHRSVPRRLNAAMNRAAAAALEDVDLVLFVIEAGRWTEEDEWVLERLAAVKAPMILVMNKIDALKDRAELLPFIEQLSERREFEEIVPVSARRGESLDRLEAQVMRLLPVSPRLFPAEQCTDRDARFRAAELIREQIMERFHQELPYSLAVEIQSFEEERGVLRIEAVLWVERESQKPMVIGKQGQALKAVGSRAREAIEAELGKKVFLQLRVKVSERWPDDEALLARLGHH